jgi:hypothetical protein
MKRDYDDGVTDGTVDFFTGFEIEKTLARGRFTLFVTGVQSLESIESAANFAEVQNGTSVTHIFFGANMSFKNVTNFAAWADMIHHYLEIGYLCSLDIDVSYLTNPEFVSAMAVVMQHVNFIPQLRIAIPNINQLNYNTMLKLDDIDFSATNAGVWTHNLHSLQTPDTFTHWSAYKNDKKV